jgi:ABC-type spermidine/putrescine transport system permease subunit II
MSTILICLSLMLSTIVREIMAHMIYRDKDLSDTGKIVLISSLTIPSLTVGISTVLLIKELFCLF